MDKPLLRGDRRCCIVSVLAVIGTPVTQNSRALDLKHWATDSLTARRANGMDRRKFAYWMDCERNNIRHPENVLSKDLLLDSVMMYWMTNSGASSARLYWESFNSTNMAAISRPIGLSVFPKEIMRTSERWARGRFEQLTHFNNSFERGGHFAALEVPDTLVNELRIWRSTTRDLS